MLYERRGRDFITRRSLVCLNNMINRSVDNYWLVKYCSSVLQFALPLARLNLPPSCMLGCAVFSYARASALAVQERTTERARAPTGNVRRLSGKAKWMREWSRASEFCAHKSGSSGGFSVRILCACLTACLCLALCVRVRVFARSP